MCHYASNKVLPSGGGLLDPLSHRGSKEYEENDLVRLLNKQWSKASFGYPIHEDLRAPSSVAEMLRTES